MHLRWINPYIPLVESSPLFLPSEVNQPTETARLQLQRMSSAYSKVACELGSGSGGHLLAQAEANPDTLWIGFELRYKRIFRTAEKAQLRGLSNIRLLQANARFMQELFQDDALSALYVNFPDPWEKKRWRKHRLLQGDFLSACARVLKDGGLLSFKTDHPQYFEEVAELLSRSPRFQVEKAVKDLHNTEFNVGNIRSEFEMLFASKGLPVYLVEAKKIGNLSA